MIYHQHLYSSSIIEAARYLFTSLCVKNSQAVQGVWRCKSKTKYRPAHSCSANLGNCDYLKPVLILIHIQFQLTLYHCLQNSVFPICHRKQEARRISHAGLDTYGTRFSAFHIFSSGLPHSTLPVQLANF